MARCETCGNDYDKSFQMIVEGKPHTFDCFECAIHSLAPRCTHCRCRILGHGVEAEGAVFCCASCARQDGIIGLHDRSELRLAIS